MLFILDHCDGKVSKHGDLDKLSGNEQKINLSGAFQRTEESFPLKGPFPDFSGEHYLFGILLTKVHFAHCFFFLSLSCFNICTFLVQFQECVE